MKKHTINNDDDCLFPTELSETAGSLLELDEMVGNKETAKQNDVKQEEDPPCLLSIQTPQLFQSSFERSNH